MKKKVSYLAFLILILLIKSCHKTKNSELITFRQAIGSDITTTDPHKVEDMKGFVMSLNCFEGLFRVNSKSGSAEYGQAEDYKISDNGLVYTFNLKKNLAFSDGTPITAQTFVDSWQRAANPETGAHMAFLLIHLIKNGDDILKGKIPPSELAIKALGKYVLEVRLAFPAPYFKEILALPIAVALPMHLIQSKGNNWNKDYPIVSNGSFVYREWKPNNRITLYKNPFYHEAKNVKIEKVITYTTDDTKTAYNMYLNEQIDFLPELTNDLVAQADLRKDFYRTYFANGNYYFINTKNKPLDDIRVRKALSLSINRKTLTEKVLRSGQKPLYSYIDKMPNYPSKIYIEENIAEAKRLLTEAGYPNGKNFPEITLTYTTNDTFKRIAEFIQQEWRQKLGINIKLRNLEWKNYITNLYSYDYDLIQFRWVPDYPDPLGYLYFFDSRTAYTNYNNELFNQILDESNQSLNTTKRMQGLAHAEEILMKDLPLIPLFISYHNTLFNSQRWKGHFHNIMDVIMYRSLEPQNP